MTDHPQWIFEQDGNRFVPSELARGPWDPNAMHGGAPAALLAAAVEQHEASGHAAGALPRSEPGPERPFRAGEKPAEVQVVRMTIELLRPVPLAPLEIRTRTIRPGKKVQIVEASVFAGETEVVRATALRIRTADGVFPATADGERLPPPGAVEHFDRFGMVSFGMAMDISPVRGDIDRLGQATVWFRLNVPVVAGEATTPLMRMAAAADFGNGISAAANWDDHLFINPDLTLYVHRLPDGEWVGLDAVTWAGANGVGVAEAALYDERGRIGRSVQGLLLDRR